MWRAFILTVGLALWAGLAQAQTFPVRENVRVNDYANLLDSAAEARLTLQLDQIQADHGTDMTVLTIQSRSDYGTSPSIESFATGLFNTWGVGSAENNTGILILVARDDREMRIELGADYPPIYDEISENVIDGAFLPAFRDDAYQEGILAGVDRAYQRIAAPFSRGEEVRAEPNVGRPRAAIGLIAFGSLALTGLGGVLIYRARRKCPQCGSQTLDRENVTLVGATRTTSGAGETHMNCGECGFAKTVAYTIPTISSSSSGSSGGGGGSSSGGGFSSGGGASGRW